MKYFQLAYPIIDALDNGKRLVIDEIDSKLHPYRRYFWNDGQQVYEKNRQRLRLRTVSEQESRAAKSSLDLACILFFGGSEHGAKPVCFCHQFPAILYHHQIVVVRGFLFISQQA